MHQILAIVVLLCGMGAAQAGSGLDIYFVRHAETLKNATGSTDSGNDNTFSDEGFRQVNVLTGKLEPLHFDTILVSPAQRALNTVLPYLKDAGQKGEIWPELAECCWQHERNDIAKGSLIPGPAIQMSVEQEIFFTFRDADSRNNYSITSYADGVIQVRHAVELLKQHYFHSGKAILIVGHHHSGQVLLADLLNIPRDKLPNLKNAKLTHLRQNEDGRFTLLTINGKDVARPQ